MSDYKVAAQIAKQKGQQELYSFLMESIQGLITTMNQPRNDDEIICVYAPEYDPYMPFEERRMSRETCREVRGRVR